jgi:glycosyltransferase involved in cell wall biosynthesis
MIEVSIIVPNYNHYNFLQQRFDSILNQDFENYELIILDDCSTDLSYSIIEELRNHPKVSHVIFNEENSGSPFKQWQKGLLLAQGKYIWIAESDDVAESNFLSKMIPFLSKNLNVGLVFCNMKYINDKGEIIGDTNNWFLKYTKTENHFTKFNGIEFCKKHLLRYNIIQNASGLLFKRDLVSNNINWIDTSLRSSGDWKLWINIAINSDIICVNEYLNYYRHHPNNTSGNVVSLKTEGIYIVKELIQKKVFLNYKIFESLCYWSFYLTSWHSESNFSSKNIKLYFQKNLSIRSVVYLFIFFVSKIFQVFMRKVKKTFHLN